MAKATIDKTIWCDPGWFRGSIYYGFCPSEKAWKKEAKRLNIDLGSYPTTAASCKILNYKDDTKRICIVTVRDGLELDHNALEVACLLTHEAVHVWQELTEKIGEEAPSAEFEAYSIQAISQELIHAFEQTRRKLDECGK